MKLVSGNAEIKIPLSVAVCPDCGKQLTIYPDGWTEEPDGWTLDTFTVSCEDEPEIGDEDWNEWDDAHRRSFGMPYIYWMPITDNIKAWVNKEYRFDLA